MIPRRTPQMLNWKKKNLREQNFEGEANNKLLDEEDTQRSTLNCKYLRFIFIVLYTCKVRFDIAIRSPSKRSRSVWFQQLSRLYLSNKKQYDKWNAIHSSIKNVGFNLIFDNTSNRDKR